MLNDSKMWKGNSTHTHTHTHAHTHTHTHTHTQYTYFIYVGILHLGNSPVCVCEGARNIYHQLLMNSLLMDLKYKKIFAIQFAKVTH